MKKVALLVIAFVSLGALQAQDTLRKVGPGLKNRAGDHFMFQIGYDGWTGMPDSISSHQQGFNRGVNVYFMLDKVFKSSPKFSLGLGAGVSTSNVFFKNMEVQLNSKSSALPFVAVDSVNHFKKYKVATTFLEIPLELRYTDKPQNMNKSFKAAIGLKLGTMVNAHTKGKTLLDKESNKLNPPFSQKINSKKFMNTTRFMATARVGYGIVSVFGTYGLNNLLNEGVGPEMKPFQIGITLSGL